MTGEATQSLLWHYFGSFTLYTLIVIGVLYLVYFYLQEHPQNLQAVLGRLGKARPLNNIPPTQSGLRIENTLRLEPGKNLYIIQNGKERFLIGTTPQDTRLLSALEPQDNATVLPAALPVETSAPPEMYPHNRVFRYLTRHLNPGAHHHSPPSDNQHSEG